MSISPVCDEQGQITHYIDIHLDISEHKRIADWVGGLSEKALAGRFTYMTVTDMRTVSQRLAPALAHFFNHQTHHRGQLHMMLTVLGGPSLPLDLIYFQRTEDGRRFA